MIEKKIPPPKLDVEFEFNKFVKNYGGELISEIIDKTPMFKNADYIFNNDNVVAELKCLKKDYIDEEYAHKVQKLIVKWLKRDMIDEIQLLKWIAGTAALPLGCYRDYIRIVKKQVERALHDANKQVQETIKFLNLKGYDGVVLIANDGNFSLENKDFFFLIQEILNMPQFKNSKVDAFVYFTVNMPARTPDSLLDKQIWVPSYKGDDRVKLKKFIDDLGFHWLKNINSVLGDDVDIEQTEDLSVLTSMKFLPKDIYKDYT